MIVGTRKQLVMYAPGYALYGFGVPGECTETSFILPDTQGAVGRTGEDTAAIGAPAYAIDRAGMAFEGVEWFSGVEVPADEVSLRVAGDGKWFFGMQGYGIVFIFPLFEDAFASVFPFALLETLFASWGVEVPEPECIVVCRGDRFFVVGIDGYGRDLAGMAKGKEFF